MNKKTRLVLVAVLLVALVATLLAACTLDDNTTTTDADKLYAAYSVAVSAKGYKPVSKTEFEEILTAATKDGGTITSVNATLETANGTEKWILTFVLGDGTTKTAEHAANKYVLHFAYQREPSDNRPTARVLLCFIRHSFS